MKLMTSTLPCGITRPANPTSTRCLLFCKNTQKNSQHASAVAGGVSSQECMTNQKKLPNGMNVESLNRVYTKELGRHSDALIDEIANFLDEVVPSDVNEISIQVFPDEYGDGYTSIGLYLHGKTTKHIPFAEYVNDLPLIDVDSYREVISIADMVVDHVKHWFSECWWKACGWKYNLPVTIGSMDFGDGSIIQLTKNC